MSLDIGGQAITIAIIFSASQWMHYRSFAYLQRLHQRDLLRQNLQQREDERFLKLRFGSRAERVLDLLREVRSARMSLLRLYRERGVAYWLFGLAYRRQRHREELLDASLQKYSRAYHDLLSRPIGQDYEDEGGEGED